jgi:hypothetical protein
MSGDEFTGIEFSRNILPRLVTGGEASLAAREILNLALDALHEAAEDIVKPAAVEKAPLLVPEHYKRAGRFGGGQGGAPGELRESCEVNEERDERRVGISFNTVYASLQHEHMDWHHADGEAKYLERAMSEKRDEVIEHLAKKIRERTGD